MSALFRAGGQWAVFVWFVVAGVLAGALRDLVYMFARPLDGGNVLKTACGLLVGAGAAIIAFVAFRLSAVDSPRVYMLIALLLGALLYRTTLGEAARIVWRASRRSVVRIGNAVANSPLCRRFFR